MRKRTLARILTLAALLAEAAGVVCFPGVARGAATQGIAAPGEVGRIEVSGVTVLSQGEVEGILESLEGEPFDLRKLRMAEESLQSLYRARGFEEVRIQEEVAQERTEDGKPLVVPKLTVSEGNPTRVGSVRLVPEGSVNMLGDERFRKYWRRIESSLRSHLAISVGDVFDQEKVTSGKRALLDTLAVDEFVGARADDVRISTVSPPPGSDPAKTGRWVGVEFHIELGDRVTFGFRGNEVFTVGGLHDLVKEQRLIGFGKDYVGAIQARIEEAYRAKGYAHTKVTALTFERPEHQERHLTYVIDEGPRVRLESVEFDGNAVFPSDQLRREFIERAPRFLRSGYYVEKEVENAGELLVEWMRSQGYLASKLVTISRRYTTKRTAIRLTVYLYEGDQTVVESVRMQGVRQFTPAEARSLLKIRENAPLDLFAFNEGIDLLKKAYRDRGFLGMKVANEGTDSVVRYSQQNRVADVLLEVAEGLQYHVSRVEVEGVTFTRLEVVLRELTLREGDVVEESKVTESEARLRKLGIFSTAAIQAVDDPASESGKVLKVKVEETTPGIIAGGPGLRNDLGVRLFGQLAYTNLMGRNHTASLSANINQRFQDPPRTDLDAPPRKKFVEYKVELGYSWPWFLMDRVTFHPSIQAERTHFNNFDASAVSFASTWERPILDKPPLMGSVTYSLEKINQFNAKLKFDDQSLTIGAITPSVRLDLRDDALAPTRGFYSSLSYELASPLLLSQRDPFPIGYTRVQGRADYLLPLGREITWFFGLRMGFERSSEEPLNPNDPNDKSGSIPLVKQFSLGGAGSIRGFKEQEINVQNLAIRGTAFFTNYRTQLDLPFAGPLRFGPFLDAGNIHVDSITLGDLRYGTGAGFHYLTPVGPVNFDFGFKIDPKPKEDPWEFYFSIGII